MATFDPTNLTYTITGFDSQGNPLVTFGCDGSEQVMGSCPVDDAADTKAYLDAYVAAYVAGIQSQQVIQPSSAVQALVNQPQTPQGS